MQAVTILQTFLDDMSAALLAGDFAAYRAGVVVPFLMLTQTVSITMETEQELEDGFNSFCEMLRSQRATDYIRLVDSAEMLDPDLIAGRYVSHIIASGTRVFDPFSSQITLRRVNSRWCAVSITNAIAKSRWPLLMAGQAKTDLRKGPEE